MNFQLTQIPNVCEAGQKDRFTCPDLESYFTAAVLFGSLSARKVFGQGAQYTALLAALFGFARTVLDLPVGPATVSTALSGSIYLTVLSTSIACYRLSPWHQLADFPGPLLLRISRWFAMGHLWWPGKMYERLVELHDRYGDFVSLCGMYEEIHDGKS